MGSETSETPSARRGFVVQIEDCYLLENGFLLAVAVEGAKLYVSDG